DQAMEAINKATAEVENSELGKDAVAPLLNLLAKSKAEIESYQKQHAPMIEQQKRNQQVLDQIDRDQKHKVRVEQEFADIVEEYNELVKQRRWAEAELIAKQAIELDRDNPVAEVMFQKARLGRANENNAELKIKKE